MNVYSAVLTYFDIVKVQAESKEDALKQLWNSVDRNKVVDIQIAIDVEDLNSCEATQCNK